MDLKVNDSFAKVKASSSKCNIFLKRDGRFIFKLMNVTIFYVLMINSNGRLLNS
jgi:hypothetical protein